MQNEKSNPIPGISGEAQPSVTYEFQTDDTVRVTANQAGEAQPLRERARIIAEKLAELGFHRDCGNNDRLVIANELETMEEFLKLLSLAPPESPGPLVARCPECGGENLNLSIKTDYPASCGIYCVPCSKMFNLENPEDMGRFFAVPATPPADVNIEAIECLEEAAVLLAEVHVRFGEKVLNDDLSGPNEQGSTYGDYARLYIDFAKKFRAAATPQPAAQDNLAERIMLRINREMFGMEDAERAEMLEIIRGELAASPPSQELK